MEFGPSGCEDNVAPSIIKAQISPYADEIWCDKIGNVIALLRGERRKDDSTPKRLLFSAHMDEVGFMIRDIESDGTLRFTTVGGILPSVLPGRRVTVGDADNRVPGVIGSKAIHLQKSEERDKPGEIRDMYIDIGAKDKEEAEKYVRRGSPLVRLRVNLYVLGKMAGLLRARLSTTALAALYSAIYCVC